MIALKDLDLPESVSVLLSDDSTMDLAVNWDHSDPAYDGDEAGSYTFEGTLVTSDEIHNIHDLNASITVVVEETEDENGKEDPEKENGDKKDPEDENGDKKRPGKDESGGILPKTATNLFNSLLIGLIILLAGGGLHYWNRRKNHSNP